jgi:ATP-dependent DNA helicase RecQ
VNELLDELRHALQTGEAPVAPSDRSLPEAPTFDYALRRLLLAWSDTGAFGADEAVLLRQLVRWSPESRLGLGPLDPAVSARLDAVSVIAGVGGVLAAVPYEPVWLKEAVVLDPPPVERSLDESFMAEPYLASVGYRAWRSPAQKEAAWFALNAAPGETRIVVLPTGAGKTLCFQMLPRFDSGLTVVIVPTVALAIDQQQNATKLLKGLPGANPVYFASDEDADAVARAVRDKETRLLFTSPESVVAGRLRPILDEFAGNHFTNLVIDECHLIETWGAQFRVEFQLLASLQKRWLERSQGRLRTFLFSATMSAGCRALLREMFGPGAGVREFVCQRSRPEMIYFRREFDRDTGQRDLALFDALLHLPRPATLYVTEVDEAERMTVELRDRGFGRIACFHGGTLRAERRRLLADWKEHRVDLMVATSAFGVGVDKRDVRAVVHACYPENLDRYYQEVGRGGRDGWSSVCLLMPTSDDRRVGQRLGVTLMGPEKMQQRWAAMVHHGENIEGYVYRLPVNARRTGLVATRTYAENVRWNKRLLVQLHRAKLLELLDVTREEPREKGLQHEEWATVRVGFPADTTDLGRIAEGMREREIAAFRYGFDQLDRLLAGTECVNRIVQQLYDMSSDQRACGGCPSCRAKGLRAASCPPLSFEPEEPQVGKCQTVARWPDPFHPAQRSDFLSLLDILFTRKNDNRGLRRLFAPLAQFEALLKLLSVSRLPDVPWRLDPAHESALLTFEPDEVPVFFHFGAIDPCTHTLARGRRSLQLRCGFHNALDADGRDIAIRDDCRIYPNPETWIC